MYKTQKQNVYDLDAALKHLDDGYRFLTTAGIKELDDGDIKGMRRDLQQARISFAKFNYWIQVNEDLNQAIRIYAKQHGIPVIFLYDKIVNNLDLHGYELKKQKTKGVR